MEFSVALRVNVEVANRAKQASGWLSSVNSFSVSSVERAMMQSGQAGRRLLWLSLRSPWEPTAERRQGAWQCWWLFLRVSKFHCWETTACPLPMFDDLAGPSLALEGVENSTESLWDGLAMSDTASKC